ncbi:MAG: hypothetical protein ACFE85_00725 [Candidatus Hodarchaeota archaeon]
MAELSKEMKIVILINTIVALIYGIFQLFLTEWYAAVTDFPIFDIHFTRVSGGTLFVLSLFGFYVFLRKQWEDFKLFLEFVIAYQIMLLILDIVYIATITYSATNFASILLATIITAVLIVVNIYIYLKEQKRE